MKTLSKVRKDLKAIGFKIQIESFSFGRVAKFIHPESGWHSKISVYGREDAENVQKLIVYCSVNKDLLGKVKDEDSVLGMLKFVK
jgi:hypothetical protein